MSGQQDLVVLPAHTSTPEAPYLATIREVRRRTPSLRGRQSELADIADFATGNESYRYIVGGAWAGKTALLSSVATDTMPEDVDVVAYFLSMRESDADSNRFLAAVVPQLAELLGEVTPVADRDQFRLLWERATVRASTLDRHLLLVVDALDEDLRPDTVPSVACVLPQHAGHHSHVLVSGRPHPELPQDVAVEHPLRRATLVELRESEYAQYQRSLAEQEIAGLLSRHRSELAVDILGCLTAAAGPLSIMDIGELTSRPLLQIGRFVEESAGRSLQPVALHARQKRYQFAHASLLEHCLANPYTSHPKYLKRLTEWSLDWQRKEWRAVDPDEVPPSYFFDSYPDAISADRDRLDALLGDVYWIEHAIRISGVDNVLASLRTAARGMSRLTGARSMLNVVQRQALNLRESAGKTEPGFVLRQLCLEALACEAWVVAEACAKRLQVMADPGIIPTIVLADSEKPAASMAVKLRQQMMIGIAGGGVVTVTEEGRLLRWSLASSKARPMEVGGAFRVAGAPQASALLDGRLGIGGSDGRVWILDPSTPDSTPRLMGEVDGPLSAMTTLADGRLVTACRDRAGGVSEQGSVHVWSDDGRAFTAAEFGRICAELLAPLPNGGLLAYTADQRVLYWSSVGRRSEPICLSYGEQVISFCGLPDGRALSVVATRRGGHVVRILDPMSPVSAIFAPDSSKVSFDVRESYVDTAIALSSGYVVLATADCFLTVWSINDSQRRIGRVKMSSRVLAIAALTDGRIVALDTSGEIFIWDVEIRSDPEEIHNDRLRMSAIACGPDGSVLTARDDGYVKLWRADEVTPTSLGLQTDSVAVVVTAGGDYFSAGGFFTPSLRKWTPSGEFSESASFGWVSVMAPAPDGGFLTGGVDGRINRWHPTTSVLDPTLLGRLPRAITAIAGLPNGNVMTGDQEGVVALWSADGEAEPIQLLRLNSVVSSVAVLAGGQILLGTESGDLLSIEGPNAALTPTLLGSHPGGVIAIAAVSDHRAMSAGRDQTIRLWDTLQGVEICRLCSPVEAIDCLPSADDCAVVAVAHDGNQLSILHCPA
ncbi:WD40 repeat domain-containing protein [Kribbella sp. NPDC051586]|uniref:WD40 repeat domain-containing protein n=1 Tax=Kribbella sp. NPDC051586 TaxID=3364118 RepID=UPI0037B39DF0